MPEHEEPNPFMGLSAEECRAQLQAYLVSRQQLRKKIERSIEVLETWKKRKALALQHGRQDLHDTASAAFSTEYQDLSRLNKEFSALDAEITRVQGQIEAAFTRASAQISGVNADALLASLEAMAGKSADKVKLDRQLADAEGDELLAKLKGSLEEGKT